MPLRQILLVISESIQKLFVIQQQFSVSFGYPVHFVEGLFQQEETCNTILQKCGIESGSKFLFVTDKGVADTHPQLIAQVEKCFQFSPYKLASARLIIEGGEAVKNNFDAVDRILFAIDQHGIDRHSYVVGIGGGAVLDVVGFAAAIAHRGIRHIRIPTTVLSQNDSGVGVKNGINHFGKKNFLGTFSPPFAVINDSSFLSTLSDRDFRCGIAEAIKVGLVKDETFFNFIEENVVKLNQRDHEIAKRLIHRCAEIHLQHIASGDPFELGNSRPLDYGHWSAHKMEQLSNYRIYHGEAVVAGMCLDAAYAHAKGMLGKTEMERLLSLCLKLNFQLFYPEMKNGLMNGLREFREHLGGELTIMLLQRIGKGIEVHQIDESVMTNAVSFLESFKS